MNKEKLIENARKVKEEEEGIRKYPCGVNAANNARIARKILEQRVVGKQNG